MLYRNAYVALACNTQIGLVLSLSLSSHLFSVSEVARAIPTIWVIDIVLLKLLDCYHIIQSKM